MTDPKYITFKDTPSDKKFLGLPQKAIEYKKEKKQGSFDDKEYKEIISPFIINHDELSIYHIKGYNDSTRIYQYHAHCKCYFTKCKPNYTVLYSYFDTILIGFNLHYRDCTEIYNFNIDYELFISFIERLKQLCEIISSKKYSKPIKILLFGHSFGMAYATMTAYILLRLICHVNGNKIFLSSHENLETSISRLIERVSEFIILQDLEISVIGSGGVPILFTKESEFINFFNLLEKRYINFYNGTTFKDITSFDGDPFMVNQECLNVIYSNYVVHFLLLYRTWPPPTTVIKVERTIQKLYNLVG